MSAHGVWIIIALELLLAGGFMLIIPLITRRGLLFGVYVGERVWGGEEARRITRGWYFGMVAALLVSLVAGAGLAFSVPPAPRFAVLSVFLFLALSLGCYLRAYVAARALAGTVAAPPPEPPLAETPASLALPVSALIAGLICGAGVVGYTWWHYPQLPARIPTHFGPSGAPDAWSPKSFVSVMMLPLGTLLMSVILGVVACLTATAKRAVRQHDGGISIDAQVRFRRAVTRLLSGISLLVTLMMGVMSIAAVRTALGQAEGMPPILWPLTIGMAVLGVGGSIYIAVRYGQGGARLERRAADSALTDGLADNERWILGAFYVNRDDPAIFVEKRFGLGYTINLGNPKAIALLVLFCAVIITLVVAAATMPQTS